MEKSSNTFASFDWDEAKRLSNFLKHGIDFENVVFALQEPRIERPSHRHGESRTMAICREAEDIITVIYTMRGDVCRIISARPASRYEQANYHNSDLGRTD